jgi:hypothetical protein
MCRGSGLALLAGSVPGADQPRSVCCACAGQIASGQHSAASSKSLIKWALAAADAVYVSADR